MRLPLEPGDVVDGNDMVICGKCGWHKLSFSHDCLPQEGKNAQMLARVLRDIPSTQLGHGGGKITFMPSETVHVTFGVGQKTFKIDGVFGLYLLHDLTLGQAADIVRFFAGLAKELAA